MLRSDLCARAADVAKPRRKLCPATPPGSNPNPSATSLDDMRDHPIAKGRRAQTALRRQPAKDGATIQSGAIEPAPRRAHRSRHRITTVGDGDRFEAPFLVCL